MTVREKLLVGAIGIQLLTMPLVVLMPMAGMAAQLFFVGWWLRGVFDQHFPLN